MDNVLESYLVRLGFSTDEPAFRKLTDTMARADEAVTAHASGMAKHILEAQGAIGGAFLSISAGIVGTIRRAIGDGVRDGLKNQIQQDLTQISPQW